MDQEKTPDELGRGHRLPRTLLVDHAAALLGVSRRTVYNRIHEGRLKTIRTRSGTQRVLLESLESLSLPEPPAAALLASFRANSSTR